MIANSLQLIAIIIATSVLVPHASVHQHHDLTGEIPLLVPGSLLFKLEAMHVNALANAQKLFSQMLILRHFKEVNTQANTQRMHTYKPKTLFATIANAQPSIHTANHI